MHPVEPRTIVRGPEALTISFITRADSQPWQVRCPDVKYSSSVTRLTPLNGSRICVALVNVVVSAISVISLSLGCGSHLLAHAPPILDALASPAAAARTCSLTLDPILDTLASPAAAARTCSLTLAPILDTLASPAAAARKTIRARRASEPGDRTCRTARR